MRLLIGTVSAGDRPSTKAHDVEVIEFHARSTNEDPVYVGNSDVTTENGRELTPDSIVVIRLADLPTGASIKLNTFYTAGKGKIDWVAIVR